VAVERVLEEASANLFLAAHPHIVAQNDNVAQ
jgi:hypothetical protein